MGVKPSLQPIYERLNSAPRYHPMNAQSFADWSMEAGDTISVSRNGTATSAPVGRTTLKWNGSQTMEINAGGEQERAAVAKVSQKKYASGRGGSGLRNDHYLHLYAWDLYGQMVSGLELTGSTAHLYVNSLYDQMRSGLMLTASTAHLYVDSRYDQMTSGLFLTASTAHLYVDSKYDQMTSGLKLTASTAHLYVDSKYTQMTAGLKLTASTAHLYVDSKYDQMTSGLKLTASTAHLYVDSKYDQMTSGLKLTASTAHLYVDSKYDQMTAGLKLTSSTAHLYADDMYKRMKSGLQLTSSSAALYVKNRTTRAQIIARINGEGHSEALIEAENVAITGDTTLSGTMEITDGALYVKKNMTIGTGGAGHMVTINNGWINAPNIQVNSGGSLTLVGTGTGEYYTLSASSIQNYIKKAAVENNILKLWKVTDADESPSITFSKATSLSGAWSGSVYRVTAKQNGTEVATHDFDPPMRLYGTTAASNFSAEITYTEGSTTTAKKSIYGYLRIFGNGDSATVRVNTKNNGTGTDVASISVKSVYEDGWADAANQVSIPSTTGTMTNYAEFKWPKKTVDNTPNSRKYYITFDDPVASGSGSSLAYTITAHIKQNSVSGSEVAKGSKTITSVYTAGYNQGKTDGAGSVTAEAHTHYRTFLVDITYGSTGTKTVKLTATYSATESVPWNDGANATLYW